MSSGSPHPGPRRPVESLLRSVFDPTVAVIPIRPLTLNDLIVGALRAVARHWRVTVGFTAAAAAAFVTIFVAAVSALAFVVKIALDSSASSTDPMAGLMVGGVLIAAVSVCLVLALGIPCDAAINGVTTIAADRAIRGAPVVFAEIFGLVRQRFWPLCRLMAAFYLMIIVPVWALPFLLLLAGAGQAVFVLFPLIFVAEFAMGVVFSLAPVVLIVEGAGVTLALKRSAQLARPAFWRLLGLHTAWVVLLIVMFVLTSIPFGLTTWAFGDVLVPGPVVELAWVAFVLAYFSVAIPVFRTAQTLVYTDLCIRQGDYGDQLHRERTEHAMSRTDSPILGATTPNVGPVFGLRPYHLARAGIAVAVLLALWDLPGIPWLIIAAGCGYGEWHTRTEQVAWPPRAHEFLGSVRLAGDTQRTGISTEPATVSLRKTPSHPLTDEMPPVSTATRPVSEIPGADSDVPAIPAGTSVLPSDSAPEPTSSTGDTPPTPHRDRAEPVVSTSPAATRSVNLSKSAIGFAESAESAETPTPNGSATATPPVLPPADSPLPPANPPQPVGASGGHRLATVVVLGVVAALTIGAGTIWYLLDRSADLANTAGSPNSLRATFPDRPSSAWSFDATTVFATAKFAAPVSSPTRAAVPGFLDLGDLLVTTVYQPGTDRDPGLVAIDARTGALQWHSPLGFDGSCAATTVDGMLPCYSSPGIGPDRFEGVSFYRVSDGSIDHRIPISNISRIAVVGEDVVTAGYDRISRGTTSDLREHWSVERTSPERCQGSGDAQYFAATEEFVYFGTDVGSMVLRASDGKRVVPTDAISVAVYPGRGLTAVPCPGGSRSPRDTVVVDEHGEYLRTHDEHGGFTAPLVLPGAPDLYFVDGDAYDFASGEQVWSAGSGVTDIIDDTVVHLAEKTLSAHDFDTGAARWSTPFEVSDSYTVPFQWLTDRERVIFAKDERIEAVDLRSGVTAWSIPAGDGNPQRAGQGFAVMDTTKLTYYAPTGAVATGPADRSTGGAADSTVTRCGKTPELTPIQYRTGSEGLVVRMELRAACPSGDIVATNALHVRISERNQTIADGVFDFADQPLLLPPPDGEATVEHEFVFPVGTFWRLPNTLGSADPGARQVDTAFTTHVVACTDLATTHGPQQGRPRPGPATSSTAVGPAAGFDTEAAALDALRVQADADRPWVQRHLADRWLPQLSSKQLGLIAADTDGQIVTWTATAILEQHLRLRLQYPEVRLVWSDEWRTFDLRGWWVTIAGTTFPDADAANGWCDAKRIAVDECFAKLVSDTRGAQATTRYRHR
ncbi:PQQ-binding-like beta-propeller repeat protein [Nocardia fluminea]|uniref:outer membrane protein assembly factor BamB family protein n=1 Tax=Nocardia fluminea TaxID=134984 RepID=UPI00366261CB